eukprot:518403-Pleurochrysis_carterae.AAC.1
MCVLGKTLWFACTRADARVSRHLILTFVCFCACDKASDVTRRELRTRLRTCIAAQRVRRCTRAHRSGAPRHLLVRRRALRSLRVCALLVAARLDSRRQCGAHLHETAARVMQAAKAETAKA